MEAIRPMTDYLLHLKLRFASEDHINPTDLKSELKGQLDNISNRLSELSIQELHSRVEIKNAPEFHNRIEIISYLLAVLGDEIIIRQSGWEYSDEWRKNYLLESDLPFLRGAVGGELFFDLLETEGQNPLMTELFYTCLIMGFGQDSADYNRLKQRLYQWLPDTLPEDEQQLSPGAAEYVSGDTRRLPPMFGLMTLVVISLVSTVLYVAASHMLWDRAADFLHTISHTLLTKGY